MEKRSNKYYSIFIIFLIVLLCILTGIERIIYSDYNPINGDFQNYNGFRRLLSGQIPFEDFYFYLGLGPLYLNSLLLLLIGNNFTNSLFVTNFLTAAMFSVAIFLIFYLNRLNKALSLSLTLIILMAALGYQDILNIYLFFKDNSFIEYVYPGNSIRMQRAFLPFLVVLFIVFLKKFNVLKRIKNENNRIILFGILSGLCLAWSNDYGISVFIAYYYIFMLKYFKFTRRFIWGFLHSLVGSTLGVIIIVSILTFGNFQNWVDYNFFGVAKYQFWYYATSYSDKVLTLTDMPINLEIIFGLSMILYFSWKVRKGRNSFNDTLLLFLILGTILAGYAYSISSSKGGLFEPFYLIIYLSLYSIVINSGLQAINKSINYRSLMLPIKVLFILVISIQIYNKTEIIKDNLSSERGVFIEELGGYLSKFGEQLKLISNNIETSGEIFSTYSSGLEVIENKYHPSGIDYLIHVLGDQYREKYLKSFNKISPEYVTTIREDFTHWELWVKRANWFFYREYLKSYEPVAVTPYNVIWKKSNKEMTIDSKIKEYSLIKLSSNSWEIKIETDSVIGNAIADITIGYSCSWKKERLYGMGLRKIINVTDGWEAEAGGYSIPNEHSDYHIPVRINNGKGNIIITAYPISMTNLRINSVKINTLLPDKIDYNAVEEKMYESLDYETNESVSLSDLTDENWESGINRSDRRVLLVEQTFKNYSTLKKSSEIEINRENKMVISVEKVGSYWIHVRVDKPIMNAAMKLKIIK